MIVKLPVTRLSGEFSVAEVLSASFTESPLAVLGRNDVIFRGTSTLLAAREKSGKSTLLRHLVSGWVLDGLRVLYLSEEFRRVWKRQLEALGIEASNGHFQIVEALGETSDAILRRAQTGPEDIVILDTATWLLGISLANRDQVIEALKPWVSLCRTGKTLIICGHLTKRDEVAGSHAFAAGVDTIIEYRESEIDDEALRVVKVRSRMQSDRQEPFAVRKVGATFTIEDVPHSVHLTEKQNTVLAVLPTEAKDALSLDQIMQKTGFREGTARHTIKGLIDLKLVRDVTGNHGTHGGAGNAARYIVIDVEDDA